MILPEQFNVIKLTLCFYIINIKTQSQLITHNSYLIITILLLQFLILFHQLKHHVQLTDGIIQLD